MTKKDLVYFVFFNNKEVFRGSLNKCKSYCKTNKISIDCIFEDD